VTTGLRLMTCQCGSKCKYCTVSPTLVAVIRAVDRRQVQKMHSLFEIYIVPRRNKKLMSNVLTDIAENVLEKDEFTLIDQLSQSAGEVADVAQESIRRIDAMLRGLDPQEFDVLMMVFGLDGEDPLSIDAASTRTGLPIDQVRQIKMQALAKLREPARYLSLVNEN
jgi:DNA-directed RNA polymerase sigma subunit (sigma70/sigma32)